MGEVLEGATLLKVNRSEAQLLTGETDPAAAAERLVEMGAELVAVTLGPDGALLRGAVSADAPGVPADAVDTTGAGRRRHRRAGRRARHERLLRRRPRRDGAARRGRGGGAGDRGLGRDRRAPGRDRRGVKAKTAWKRPRAAASARSATGCAATTAGRATSRTTHRSTSWC